MDQLELAAALRTQSEWCRKLGSPFYYELLLRIADNVEQVFGSHVEAHGRSLVPLRFLAGAHRLVLAGDLPDLAQHYPSVGGDGDAAAAWLELAKVLDLVRDRMPERVQTNEVGRCTALLPGFQQIAIQTGLPLRLREVGCSAGLNLRFDHLLGCDLQVIERKGCDLNPIAIDDEGRLTLLSFVWPDQTERFTQLTRAIEIAREVPAEIEQAGGVEWIARELAQSQPGAVTVVFHSVVMMYFSNEDRAKFAELMAHAGARATAQAPLAWLSMEQGAVETDIDLTVWPGSERRTIARASFHGRSVELVP